MARWGGEEFIVLLPEIAKENAFQVASRILNSVSTFRFSPLPDQLTVSIGLAGMHEQDIDTSEKLIAAADRALYEAKSKGRNRVEMT